MGLFRPLHAIEAFPDDIPTFRMPLARTWTHQCIMRMQIQYCEVIIFWEHLRRGCPFSICQQQGCIESFVGLRCLCFHNIGNLVPGVSLISKPYQSMNVFVCPIPVRRTFIALINIQAFMTMSVVWFFAWGLVKLFGVFCKRSLMEGVSVWVFFWSCCLSFLLVRPRGWLLSNTITSSRRLV